MDIWYKTTNRLNHYSRNVLCAIKFNIYVFIIMNAIILIYLFYIIYCVVVVEQLLVPHYPFNLDSAGQVIDGFVDSKVVVGSKVRVTEIEGKKFIENGMDVGYLQLVVRKGKSQLNGVCILIYYVYINKMDAWN